MRRAELLAAAVALVVGGPLVFLFSRAVTDGMARASEAPYRALLGDATYEALTRGDETELHYMGDDRLAPDFTVVDRHGEPWKLSDHAGKVVVMNFWTITCAPCVEEMPSLDQLAQLVGDRDDVEVVAISTDQGWSDVEPVFAHYEVRNEEPAIRVLFDPDKSVVNGKFGTALFPETWVIDPDGVIRLRIDGPRNWTDPQVLDLIDQLS